MGDAWRSKGEGSGGGGECSGRSGKLRAAFPPQSVELECGGARRRRRLLRHQTPGLGGAWGHLLLSQEEPSPDRFQPDFSLPVSFFFLSLSLFSPNTFFLPSDLRLLQPEPSRGSALGLLIPPAASRDARPASGRRKEEKLVGGVSPSHSNPLPANPNLPRGPP